MQPPSPKEDVGLGYNPAQGLHSDMQSMSLTERSSSKKSSPGVYVKYEMFPFHKEVIKTLSVCGNLVVFGSGNQNDLVKVVSFSAEEKNIEYRQVQLHKVMNTRQNFIEWSPNGQYLALGWEKVTIWQYEGGIFNRFKEYPDTLYEVTAFAWGPDSRKYAVAGLNKSLSIFVRSLEADEKIKELENEFKVLGLVWDPFDKHLASLIANNEIVIYKCAGWERSHTINLNLTPLKPLKQFLAKREDRKIDWSPDFRYLLVPALDDRTLPLVVALNRNNNFAARCVFTGPFSSINCVKFSPVLYLHEQEPINIFAMGDNDGSISIWGIGQRFFSKQPFFLLKSHKNENELIEDIEWSSDGRVLFASTYKQYLITVIVQDGNFGRRLSHEEKRVHLQNIYGSLRSFTSTQNQFKIFNFEDMKNGKPSIEKLFARAQTHEQNKLSIQEPQEFVLTEQKTISDGGKKKIIPSKFIKKDEAQSAKAATQLINGAVTQAQPVVRVDNPPEAKRTSSSMRAVEITEVRQPISSKNEFRVSVEQKLLLPVLDTSPSYFLIDSHRSIEIEYRNAPNESTIKIYCLLQENRELAASINIPGRINHLTVLNETIFIYSSECYLYTFGMWGQALELPLFLGRVHLFRANRCGDILSLSVSCDLKVFNASRNKLYFTTNIFELVAANLEDKESRQINKIIDAMEFGDDRSVAVQFTNKKVFLWGQHVEAWSLVDTALYELDKIQSAKSSETSTTGIGSKEQIMNRQFMQSLLKPPNLTPVHKLQYNAIFYRKHKPDMNNYAHSLIQYIKGLVKQRMDNRLRTVLYNHFVDSNREEFMKDPPRWMLEQLLAIQSSVIEQFNKLYRPLQQ